MNKEWRFWDENLWLLCPTGTLYWPAWKWALCSPTAAPELSWAGSGDSRLGHRHCSASWWNVKVWLSFWEQPWLSLPPGVTVIKVIKKERYEITKKIEAVKSILPNPWRLKLRLPQAYKLVEIFIVREKTKPYTSVCKKIYFSRSGICIKQDMDYHKKSPASCTLFLLHFVSALLPVGSYSVLQLTLKVAM